MGARGDAAGRGADQRQFLNRVSRSATEQAGTPTGVAAHAVRLGAGAEVLDPRLASLP
jgi:hypothetical protein